MLTIPKILDNAEFLTEKVTFKWDETRIDYFTYKVKDNKLVDTLWLLNHKATLGLTAACSEWIFWRLSKIKNVDAALNAIEPLWLGLIDKQYIKNWKYTGSRGDTTYFNIIWIIFTCHFFIRDNYIKGDHQIQFRVMNIIKLARHVTSDKHMFDNWLNDCINRSIKLFPTLYDRGRTLGGITIGYDSSTELAIPREFYFEPGFDYETADIDGLLEKYINEVDHSNKVFFWSATELIEQGFQGIPYKYELK